MKKEQFLLLCRTNPEEVFKLVTTMGETISALMAQVETLNNQVDALKVEIKELKARLDKNSRNSNKPPSTDEFIKPKSQRKKSGKKTGGQKGHKGHTMKMSQTPDEIIIHKTKDCQDCGHRLDGINHDSVERRQVFDLPSLKIFVTEHRSETVTCPCCGKKNKAGFPEGVTQNVQYCNNLRALLVYLNQYQLVPYNRAAEFIEDICGCSLSEATIYNAIEATYEQLGPVETEIINRLVGSDVVNVDESGGRVEAKRQWLHVASTPTLTHYKWHPKRGHVATDEIGILPQIEGILVHDYWKPFYKYSCGHSLCNIHNIRELTGIFDLTGQTWTQEMIELLLEIKERVDEQKLLSAALNPNEIADFEKRYDLIVAQGYRANPPPESVKKRGRKKQGKARNMLNRLSSHRHEVLAFMRDFRVPFENNLAERDIRMVKVKQKISGVFRSTRGADMFCRIRSYISTARKNSVPAFEAIKVALDGKPIIPEL
ncbi:MAG: IS66 family transposase [Thermoanaerobacteraceae bacterium]|nr:IS66 family transposase [Thermoanaerobacteraceae bacterium]